MNVNSMINNQYTIKFVSPNELNKIQLNEIYTFIYSGGQVRKSRLKNKIRKAFLLGLAFSNSEIIASAAIKKKFDTFDDSAFKKSETQYSYSNYLYELGYVFVKEEYRNQKLALNLTKALCEKYRNENIFATVRNDNDAMQKILKKLKFVQTGKPFYDRDRKHKILLFIKEKMNGS